METSRDKEVSEAARRLGKSGAKGGRARAASLTPEERQRIARNAVNARWARQKAQREEVQDHA
jgi:hypothetical protein